MRNHKLLFLFSAFFLWLSLSMTFSDAPKAQANPDTLIDRITTLVNSVIDWNQVLGAHYDVILKFAAYSFGKMTKAELESWMSSLTSTQQVAIAYAEGAKYGIEDEATIKWFLDNQDVMSNGLPKSGNNAGKDYFAVEHRYYLRGFYWANKYGYQTAKWDTNKAYQNFKWAIDHAAVPAALWVYYDNTTYVYWGTTEPRFYDECAQTIDVFLYFYQLGITEALDEALETWNYVNSIHWTGDHYKYRPGDSGYECESGGFLQIALKLKYYAPTTGNITRITDDMVKRYLSNGWLSPQWSIGTTPYYAVVHMNPSNNQRRLQNTLMAWSSLYGNYYNLTTEQRTNLTSLLTGYDGYDPAWKLLYNSTTGLYNATSGMFHDHSDGSDWHYCTATAAIMLMWYGIVPGTGAVAMPINEMMYEDRFNLMDRDLFALYIDARTLRISIQTPGTITFQYGSGTCTYNFTQRGVYEVEFASDWNSITTVTRTGDLPTNRMYFTESFGKTYSFLGPYDEDSGLFNGETATVTVYYSTDFYSENFTLDESYTFNTLLVPQFFRIYTTGGTREYWLHPSQDTATIYVSTSASLTSYTVEFRDLSGILTSYPYVEVYRVIGGSSRIVERRKVDKENKVMVSLKMGERYTLKLSDGLSSSVTYGDVLFTSTTSLTLSVKGTEFPDTIVQGYMYVRVYATRDMSAGTVTVNYADLMEKTTSVTIYVYFMDNDSIATSDTETASSFVYNWLNADNSTDYYCVVTISHQQFGNMHYRQILPRLFGENPWGMPFLGSLPFNTNLLIPTFMAFAIIGVFSRLSLAAGCIVAPATFTLFSYLGWLPISLSVQVIIWALGVMLAIVVAREKVYVV